MPELNRYWNAENLERYVISVCVHNRQALAKAMNTLIGVRDFKPGPNQDAFSVIEMSYEKGKDVDPVVIIDTWLDMGIYDRGIAREIAGSHEGDTDYEPKINELASVGGMRKAKKDIEELHTSASDNITPEQLSSKAIDLAQSWNSGTVRQYYSGAEIDELEKNNITGEKLNLGIPLFDETLYKNAGLHKGTVKGKIFRSKHGKTRQQCWEVAQHLRQGRNVLYFTLEGLKRDISGNIKEVVKDEWDNVKNNIFVVDGMVDLSSIRSTIIQAHFSEEIDVVVIDYLQELQLDVGRYVAENMRYNDSIRDLTNLCVKYDFLLDILSQANAEDKNKNGWGNVPEPHDAYGSKQIIKAASLLLVGFRPNLYPDLLHQSAMPGSMPKLTDWDGHAIPYNSVFMKPVRSRKKINCLHQWAHFIDSDYGLQLKSQSLL